MAKERYEAKEFGNLLLKSVLELSKKIEEIEGRHITLSFSPTVKGKRRHMRSWREMPTPRVDHPPPPPPATGGGAFAPTRGVLASLRGVPK